MANKRIFNAIDSSPDHAAALGRFIAHWASLEPRLIMLLQILLRVNNVKARFVYQQFVSTAAKIELLQRLNHFFTLDQSLKDTIKDLLQKTEKLNEIRNAFIHADWAFTTSDHLLRIPTTLPGYTITRKRWKKFSIQDIQDQVEKIVELSQSFDDLIFPILEALPIQCQL